MKNRRKRIDIKKGQCIGKWLFLVVFLFYKVDSYAQRRHNVDSLKQVIRNAPDDTLKINNLYTISRFSLPAKDSTLYYADVLENLAIQLKNPKGLAMANFCKSLVYLDWGYYEKAEELAKISIANSLEAKNSRFQAYGYNTLGEIYQQSGRFPEARAAFVESEKIKRQTGDLKGLWTTLFNLGKLNVKMNNTEEAIAVFEEYLKVAVKGLGPEMATCEYREGLGLVYLGKKDYAQAEKYFQMAYDTCKDRYSNFDAAVLRSRLGRAQLGGGRVERAIGNILPATRWLHNQEESKYAQESLLDVAQIYKIQNRFGEAEKLLEEIYTNSKENQDFEGAFRSSLRLADLSAERGSYTSAYQWEALARQFQDSLFNEAKQREFALLQVRYDTEKKENDIVLLSAENELVKVKNTQQRNLIIAVVLGLLVSVLVGILYWRRYVDKKNANHKLDAQREEIQRQNGVIKQSLEEKELLMEEINHRAKNNLYTIECLLKAQQKQITDPKAKSALEESRHRVQSISLLHQKLSDGTSPGTINIKNYFEAILAEHFSGEPHIALEQDIEPLEIDSSTAVALGLVLNELATNSRKYAFGWPNEKTAYQPQFKVLFKKEEDQINWLVADNGLATAPFNPDTPEEDKERSRTSSYFGLRLVKGLMGQLGGHVDISQEKGFGVHITLPSITSYAS